MTLEVSSTQRTRASASKRLAFPERRLPRSFQNWNAAASPASHVPGPLGLSQSFLSYASLHDLLLRKVIRRSLFLKNGNGFESEVASNRAFIFIHGVRITASQNPFGKFSALKQHRFPLHRPSLSSFRLTDSPTRGYFCVPCRLVYQFKRNVAH